MKAVMIVLLPLVMAASAASGQQADAAAAEKAVRTIIADYNAAYAKNDLDVYFSYFAPDITQWFPNGRVDLKSYRDSWTKSVKEGNVMQKAEVTDLQVQVAPAADSAIATYILRTASKNAKGEVEMSDFQETDVLFKRGGQWKLVHIHYSPSRPQRP